VLAGGLALVIAWLTGEERTPPGLKVGVIVSAVTFLGGRAIVALLPQAVAAYPRLLLETAVRLVVPIAAVAAIAIDQRELLDKIFLAYFLPFQFVTLVADTLGAIWRVRDEA
jgi:hypothetical protein